MQESAIVNALRGRGRELDELERLVAGAVGGTGAVVQIEGPPGIGKSSLLAVAAELGAARGMTIAAGRCDELDQISPWSSLLEAFGSSRSAIVDRATLLAAGSGRMDQRRTVLDGFRDSLESAASRQPVMVLLDDLQWADLETVSALGWLPGQLFSYPIVWLLARRPLPASPPLQVMVDRVSASGAHQWRVGPLDEVAAAELAADMLGPEAGRRTGDLLRVTGGNPLFILEVLRLPHDRGGRLDPAGPATVEPSLQAIVGAHLRSLSPPTVELLKVASVLGQQFASSEVGELAGRPSARLLTAVEEAITAGVLVETDGQLAFRHDVFRQVLYANIPASLRRSLHSEAAVVLRRHGASATRLAHQLMIGAEVGDPEAIASLGEAVGELFGTSPWAAADLAVRLVDLAPPDSGERTAAVASAVLLLGWAGRPEEAQELGESFLQAHSVSPAVQADIEVGLRRAWTARLTAPYPRPVPEHLLDDPQVPAPVRANLIAFDQIGPLGEGDVVRADEALERAAGLLAGAGGVLDAYGLVSLWTSSASLQGEFALALDRARRDLHLVGPAGQPIGVAMTDTIAAMCLLGLGRVGEGLEAIGRAVVAAEESGFPFFQAHSRAILVALLLEAGRLDDARTEASAASDAAIAAGAYAMAAWCLTTLVESAVHLGDLDVAESALRQLVHYSVREAINPDDVWATAVVADARGRPAVARQAVQTLADMLANGIFSLASQDPGRLPQLVGLALRHGQHEVARTVADAAVRLAGLNPGEEVLEQIALHARGLAEGDTLLLRQAYERSQPAETRLLHAILTEDLGGAHAAGGQKGEAVPALEEALAAFSGMGALADAARVRARLRALGVRKRQVAAARPDRGWASLTPAEQSVVGLVGRGLSNRATAEELLVSPDTVNTHLRHIFTKLDIRSRTQLAALLAAHDTPSATPPAAKAPG